MADSATELELWLYNRVLEGWGLCKSLWANADWREVFTPGMMASVGDAGEGQHRYPMAILSLPPSSWSHIAQCVLTRLFQFTLPLLDPIGSGCKGNFVFWPFKRASVFLAEVPSLHGGQNF